MRFAKKLPDEMTSPALIPDPARMRALLRQLPPHDNEARYCSSLSEREWTEFKHFDERRKLRALGRGAVAPLSEGMRGTACHQCSKSMGPPGTPAVFASRAAPHHCWHPACFVCSTCLEPLVDLIYFWLEGRLYCGRHHAEQLKPRCTACDEIIFSEECTEASGKFFHPQHFVCAECSHCLSNDRYVSHAGRDYCRPCYHSLHADHCSSCGLTIQLDEQHVIVGDKFRHATAACFGCGNCGEGLLGKFYLPQDGAVFCSFECGGEARGMGGKKSGVGSEEGIDGKGGMRDSSREDLKKNNPVEISELIKQANKYCLSKPDSDSDIEFVSRVARPRCGDGSPIWETYEGSNYGYRRIVRRRPKTADNPSEEELVDKSQPDNGNGDWASGIQATDYMLSPLGRERVESRIGYCNENHQRTLEATSRGVVNAFHSTMPVCDEKGAIENSEIDFMNRNLDHSIRDQSKAETKDRIIGIIPKLENVGNGRRLRGNSANCLRGTNYRSSNATRLEKHLLSVQASDDVIGNHQSSAETCDKKALLQCSSTGPAKHDSVTPRCLNYTALDNYYDALNGTYDVIKSDEFPSVDDKKSSKKLPKLPWLRPPRLLSPILPNDARNSNFEPSVTDVYRYKEKIWRSTEDKPCTRCRTPNLPVRRVSSRRGSRTRLASLPDLMQSLTEVQQLTALAYLVNNSISRELSPTGTGLLRPKVAVKACQTVTSEENEIQVRCEPDGLEAKYCSSEQNHNEYWNSQRRVSDGQHSDGNVFDDQKPDNRQPEPKRSKCRQPRHDVAEVAWVKLYKSEQFSQENRLPENRCRSKSSNQTASCKLERRQHDPTPKPSYRKPETVLTQPEHRPRASGYQSDDPVRRRMIHRRHYENGDVTGRLAETRSLAETSRRVCALDGARERALKDYERCSTCSSSTVFDYDGESLYGERATFAEFKGVQIKPVNAASGFMDPLLKLAGHKKRRKNRCSVS